MLRRIESAVMLTVFLSPAAPLMEAAAADMAGPGLGPPRSGQAFALPAGVVPVTHEAAPPHPSSPDCVTTKETGGSA
jgi:hypothetical protein